MGLREVRPGRRISFPPAITGAVAWGLSLFASGAIAALLPLDFEDELVASGFSLPTSMAFLPDGRVLVTEQRTGAVRLVLPQSGANVIVHTFLDVNVFGMERGLVGVAIDPRWPEVPYAYFYYTRTGDICTLCRLTASGDLSSPNSTSLAFGSYYDVLGSIPDSDPIHQSGTLRFGPDAMLYVSIGDDNVACAAQDSTTIQGSILRLMLGLLPPGGGGPPPRSLLDPGDNPYSGNGDDLSLVHAFGFRNPFRFSIDRETGYLYVADVGSALFEELTEVQGGENCGWPFREGSLVQIPAGCAEPGGTNTQTYHAPLTGYVHDPVEPNAIMAGPVYRREGGPYEFPPYYDGIVFFADYYQGVLRGMKLVDGVWRPVTHAPNQPSELDWGAELWNISDYAQGPDGAIYYISQFPAEVRRIVYTGQGTLSAPEPDTGPALRFSANPFRAGAGTLEIGFRAEAAGPVRLDVLDVQGRLVRGLLDGDFPEGAFSVRWDGRDERGTTLKPGVYFVRLESVSGASSRRAVMLP